MKESSRRKGPGCPRGLLTQQTGTGWPEAAASEVTKAKTWAWEEFGEVMEKDFWLSSRKVWQTIIRLRKGNQGLAQSTLSGGELLTRTADVVK